MRGPANVRNVQEWGGGALIDIGCYPIQIARFLFEQEPVHVVGRFDRDPEFGIDRLTAAILDCPSGHCVFSCSTQMVPYQKVQILGTKARIELQIPFNAPPDRPARLFVDTGADLFGGGMRTEEFPVCDQYTIQGDLFSQAVRHGGEVPTPLEDSILNMAAIWKMQAGGLGCSWFFPKPRFSSPHPTRASRPRPGGPPPHKWDLFFSLFSAGS